STSQGQQRESWRGRHERSRTSGVPETALASHSGTVSERDLSTATGEAGGNPQAGRRGAEAGHPDGTGPIYPASGDAGSATQVGPDVFQSQLRVSTRALGASGGGSGAAAYRRRLSLVCGLGPRGSASLRRATNARGRRGTASFLPFGFPNTLAP